MSAMSRLPGHNEALRACSFATSAVLVLAMLVLIHGSEGSQNEDTPSFVTVAMLQMNGAGAGLAARLAKTKAFVQTAAANGELPGCWSGSESISV